MTKSRVILVGSFLLMFAAGASLGLLIARSFMVAPVTVATDPRVTSRPDGPKPIRPERRHRSVMADELKLTAEQQEQMGKIWSESRHRQVEGQRAATSQRDQEIRALVPAARQAEYDAIIQKFPQQMEADRRAAFQEGLAETRKVLTPDQAAKWDELMKREGPRGMGGLLRGPRDRRGGGSPTSRPTTSEQIHEID